eukprot:3196371-Rhodomonas_salina.2
MPKCGNCMAKGKPQKKCTYPRCSKERLQFPDHGFCSEHLKMEEDSNIKELQRLGVRAEGY